MIFEYGALPEACAELVSSGFGDEFVVIDPRSGVAHFLSQDYAVVWAGVQSGSWPQLPEHRIREVVTELRHRGLLTDQNAVSRRTALKAGAAGGASVALFGLTSMALPAAAMAASGPVFTNPSGVSTTDSQTGTFNIPAGAIFAVALVGGGGGGGLNDDDTNDLVFTSGGVGQVWVGTLTNNAGAAVGLTHTLGGGGYSINQGSGENGVGTGAGDGGAMGSGGYTTGNGGAGGGASSLYIAGGAVLAVAAGGGGGGGVSGADGQAPSDAEINYPSFNGQNISGSDSCAAGGGGGQATDGDPVYGGAASDSLGGYAGSAKDQSVGYSTYGGQSSGAAGLVVTHTGGNGPTNYQGKAPKLLGTTPGSGAYLQDIGFQGGLYAYQIA